MKTGTPGFLTRSAVALLPLLICTNSALAQTAAEEVEEIVVTAERLQFTR